MGLHQEGRVTVPRGVTSQGIAVPPGTSAVLIEKGQWSQPHPNRSGTRHIGFEESRQNVVHESSARVG